MKYSVVALAALGSLASAQPAFTNSNFDVKQGQPFTFTYSGCQSGCTITLENGPSTNLQVVSTITTQASGNSFTFTPNGFPSDTYAFRITDASGAQNFSPQFQYVGTGTPSTTVMSVPTSSATSTVVTSATSALTTTAPITTLTSTSAIVTMTNSTMTTMRSGTRTTSAGTGTIPYNTNAPTLIPNAADRMSSPMALFAGAVAAVAYLA